MWHRSKYHKEGDTSKKPVEGSGSSSSDCDIHKHLHGLESASASGSKHSSSDIQGKAEYKRRVKTDQYGKVGSDGRKGSQSSEEEISTQKAWKEHKRSLIGIMEKYKEDLTVIEYIRDIKCKVENEMHIPEINLIAEDCSSLKSNEIFKETEAIKEINDEINKCLNSVSTYRLIYELKNWFFARHNDPYRETVNKVVKEADQKFKEFEEANNWQSCAKCMEECYKELDGIINEQESRLSILLGESSNKVTVSESVQSDDDAGSSSYCTAPNTPRSESFESFHTANSDLEEVDFVKQLLQYAKNREIQITDDMEMHMVTYKLDVADLHNNINALRNDIYQLSGVKDYKDSEEQKMYENELASKKEELASKKKKFKEWAIKEIIDQKMSDIQHVKEDRSWRTNAKDAVKRRLGMTTKDLRAVRVNEGIEQLKETVEEVQSNIADLPSGDLRDKAFEIILDKTKYLKELRLLYVEKKREGRASRYLFEKELKDINDQLQAFSRVVSTYRQICETTTGLIGTLSNPNEQLANEEVDKAKDTFKNFLDRYKQGIEDWQAFEQSVEKSYKQLKDKDTIKKDLVDEWNKLSKNYRIILRSIYHDNINSEIDSYKKVKKELDKLFEDSLNSENFVKAHECVKQLADQNKKARALNLPRKQVEFVPDESLKKIKEFYNKDGEASKISFQKEYIQEGIEGKIEHLKTTLENANSLYLPDELRFKLLQAAFSVSKEEAGDKKLDAMTKDIEMWKRVSEHQKDLDDFPIKDQHWKNIEEKVDNAKSAIDQAYEQLLDCYQRGNDWSDAKEHFNKACQQLNDFWNVSKDWEKVKNTSEAIKGFLALDLNSDKKEPKIRKLTKKAEKDYKEIINCCLQGNDWSDAKKRLNKACQQLGIIHEQITKAQQ
jgi:hypothetical protein